jgi:tRNA pseudouridine(55) synthase
MNEKIVKIYKNLGETPLMALKRLAKDRPELSGQKMTYAGRLDPMAEGELLVLVGDECKKKDEYLGMDKEYEFEMLFGFKTDSYDLLGLSRAENFIKEDLISELAGILENKKGKFVQKYPPFSSKTVGGAPLFQKTKDGDDYDAPEREVEIYEMEFLGFREINGVELLKEIKRRINLVNGDFRQEEILKKWKENMAGTEDEIFLIAKAKMSCSSGTYVRSLVNGLSFPAVTFSIKRTKVFKN